MPFSTAARTGRSRWCWPPRPQDTRRDQDPLRAIPTGGICHLPACRWAEVARVCAMKSRWAPASAPLLLRLLDRRNHIPGDGDRQRCAMPSGLRPVRRGILLDRRDRRSCSRRPHQGHRQAASGCGPSAGAGPQGRAAGRHRSAPGSSHSRGRRTPVLATTRQIAIQTTTQITTRQKRKSHGA